MHPAARYMLWGLAGSLALFVVCYVLIPQNLLDNGGFSFYGAHWQTVVPAYGAYLVCIWGLLKSAAAMPKTPRFSVFAECARIASLLIAGLMLTPYQLGVWWWFVHVTIAASFFLTQIFAGVWVVWRLHRDWLNAGLLVLQIAGAVIASLSLPGGGRLELDGQLLFQISGCILFVRGLSRALRDEVPASQV